MICKQPYEYKEDEASKPQRRRTDGATLLPKVHLQASSARSFHECICIRRKTSLYSTAAAVRGLVVLLLMGSAVQHVAYKVLA